MLDNETIGRNTLDSVKTVKKLITVKACSGQRVQVEL
jgi:hypothetical protein